MSTVNQFSANAAQLFTSLATDLTITIPPIDTSDIDTKFDMPDGTGPIYGDVKPVTIDEVTEGTLTGGGVFDILMRTVQAHLAKEFNAQRITGNDYADVYLGAIQAVLAQATNFVLQRDASYWGALLVQQQAQAAQYAVLTTKAQVATAQMAIKIATITAAKTQIEAYTAKGQYAVAKASLGTAYTQGNLIEEQTTSYTRDAEQKVMKTLLDTWMTRKTIDDGVEVPTQIDTTSLDSVISTVKSNNNL